MYNYNNNIPYIREPEKEYDYITPKLTAVNTSSSDHKPVTMDRNPAYQSTVIANKTSDDHPPEYEIINLQPAKSDDGVKMKNPAYAETQFK